MQVYTNANHKQNVQSLYAPGLANSPSNRALPGITPGNRRVKSNVKGAEISGLRDGLSGQAMVRSNSKPQLQLPNIGQSPAQDYNSQAGRNHGEDYRSQRLVSAHLNHPSHKSNISPLNIQGRGQDHVTPRIGKGIGRNGQEFGTLVPSQINRNDLSPINMSSENGSAAQARVKRHPNKARARP